MGLYDNFFSKIMYFWKKKYKDDTLPKFLYLLMECFVHIYTIILSAMNVLIGSQTEMLDR